MVAATVIVNAALAGPGGSIGSTSGPQAIRPLFRRVPESVYRTIEGG
jgi:hypothetical protein